MKHQLLNILIIGILATTATVQAMAASTTSQLEQTIQDNEAKINQLRSLLQEQAEAKPQISKNPSQKELNTVIDRQNSELSRLQDEVTIQTNFQQINTLRSTLQETAEAAPQIPANPTSEELEKIIGEQDTELNTLQKQFAAMEQQINNDVTNAKNVMNKPTLTPAAWTYARCKGLGDSLPNNLVTGRDTWANDCFGKYVDEVMDLAHSAAMIGNEDLANYSAELYGEREAMHAYERPYQGPQAFYPSFGKTDASGNPTNPMGLVASVNPSDSCTVSYRSSGNDSGPSATQVKTDLFHDAGYSLVAMCVSGCYTPDQHLLFKNGFEEIGDAYNEKNMEIQVLTADSTRDHLKYETVGIEAYTVDVKASWQEVFEIHTLSGKKLIVTTNHALLDSNGMMRTADSLNVGESLVQSDGSPDPIMQIIPRNYYGKVYNVQPQSDNLLQNIVVAEGLLTGSVYYQNAGVKDLNRDLFRFNLPKNLVQ